MVEPAGFVSISALARGLRLKCEAAASEPGTADTLLGHNPRPKT
jgi:hypothetical protein